LTRISIRPDAVSANGAPVRGLGTPRLDFEARSNTFRYDTRSPTTTTSFHPPDIPDEMASPQALNKIAPNSPSRAKPTEIEQNIATALYELETNIPDMKSALRPLQFVSAREVR